MKAELKRVLALLLCSFVSGVPASAATLTSVVRTIASPAPLGSAAAVGARTTLSAPVLRPSLTPLAPAASVIAAPTIAPSLSAPVAAPIAAPIAVQAPGAPIAAPSAVAPEASAPISAPRVEATALTSSLEQASAKLGEVDPGSAKSSAKLGEVYDGSGDKPAVPVDAKTAKAEVDPFIEKAQQLYFPDGRKPVVAAGRGTATETEGVPTDDEMQKEMELSPISNPEREKAVIELFKQAGAAPSEIVKQDAGRGRSNYIVVKKGRTDRVIVVGAHHDKVSEGRGTIDNWTGSTMMINLYQAVRDLDTEATFVFVAFAREEEGLIGSERFLQSLTPEQRKKVDSMVNLDTLAVDGTYSWKNNSTKSLLDLIKKVAAQEKLALEEARLDGGDADSSTFRRAGIPAITVFGASMDVIFDIIHSERDNIAAFSLPHYKNAYLVTLALLKALDKTPVRPAVVTNS